MNTHPIFGHMISGMMEAQRLQAPGMEPPQPMGCPNCAQAEAEVDRLKAALDLEAKARYSMAEGLAEAKSKLAWYEGNEAAHRVILRQAKMDRDQAREDAHTAKLAQAQSEGDATALLMLMAQIREAVGDNGRRMQGPLVDYIRILFEEADPDRVSQREADLRAQDYAPAADPMDAGAWGEDKADAA